jgi:DNA-directed RNA polymerase subunit RPC12/RpoP
MPVKPSTKEEQYFLEQELKRQLLQARAEQEAMAAVERQRLKELHYMHCPKCGQKLFVENYGEVEVDVCGGCKGLWLDANELDQILAAKEQTGPLRKFLNILGG